MNTKNIDLQSAVVRFCGDSGDGMQLTGHQFTETSAIGGNDVTTLPDFPAEIRAPIGTEAGVSGFQIHFSSNNIKTAGDEVDVLIAMNPAAFKKNLPDLKKGGILIVNEDSFNASNFKKAKYDSNPLEDNISLYELYTVHKVAMSSILDKALVDIDLKSSFKKRCKNFFALGLCYWLYDKDLTYTNEYIKKKFAKNQAIQDANLIALQAGFNYGITTEMFSTRFQVLPTTMQDGTYRQITGNIALSYGLMAASKKANLNLVYCSYPITPASDILHELAKHKNFGVKTIQAEDEIASIGIALGAAYGGKLAVTATSGPGLCLKAEFVGLACSVELPLIICDVQRGGPSTGLPTKTEQSDLLLALYGRNGDAPLPVLACSSPTDCFDTAIEAARIAFKYMTPVIILSDGYLANGSDLWQVPNLDNIEEINIPFATEENYQPYKRDEQTLARKWAIPGMANKEHVLTGLEKDITGGISYDALNHQEMSNLRQEKIDKITQEISLKIMGEDKGKLLVISWGGTFGSVFSAVEQLQQEGKSITMVHLKYLNPLAKELASLIKNFDEVIIPELNMGQLVQVIRNKYAIDAKSFTKVQGKPFKVTELVDEFNKYLG